MRTRIYEVIVPLTLYATTDGGIVDVQLPPHNEVVITDMETNDIIDHDGIYEAATDFVEDMIACIRHEEAKLKTHLS